MFWCSYTIIRECINSCLLKLQLLKQSIKIHHCVVNTVAAWLQPHHHHRINHTLMYFNPSALSDERCSLWCTLPLIRLYLDNIGIKCNRTASCVFVKELALLWCGRLPRNYFFIFSLPSKSGVSFCHLYLHRPLYVSL
jgi:hypothetical protein